MQMFSFFSNAVVICNEIQIYVNCRLEEYLLLYTMHYASLKVNHVIENEQLTPSISMDMVNVNFK